MSLPKITLPIYTTKLPSNGLEIKYRPYTVREEKLLLMAAETTKMTEILNAVNQVVSNCVLNDNFDVDAQAQLDIEYIFLRLRAVSNTNIVKLLFQNTKCPNNNGGDCADQSSIDVDINDVGIEQLNEDETKYIPYSSKDYAYGKDGRQFMLDDNLGVMMRYPILADLKDIDTNLPKIEYEQQLTMKCIVAYFEQAEDKVYYTKDIPIEEHKEFYDGLMLAQKNKITNFTKRVPVIKKSVDYSCAKCNYKEKIDLVGLRDFFG